MQWLVLSRVSLQGLRVESSQLTCPNERVPSLWLPTSLDSHLSLLNRGRPITFTPGHREALLLTYHSIRVAQAPGRCKRSSQAKPFISSAKKKIPLQMPINRRAPPVGSLSFLWKALIQEAMNLKRDGQFGEASEIDSEPTPGPAPQACAKRSSLVLCRGPGERSLLAGVAVGVPSE
jgi:hypothetical protein